MKMKSILPWFGGKRTLAPEIVRQLGPHQYYLELCCGSAAVLFAKQPCSHEAIVDLHGGLINLARAVQSYPDAEMLFERLSRTLYSDDLYAQAKSWLSKYEPEVVTVHDLDWAYHYFIISWMGRNGVSGTARSNYQIATRWTKGGGSGPGRFRSAADSIPAWFKRLRNVHIMRRDIFDVIPRIEDGPGVAIYADPPYLPNTMSGSARYLHDFQDGDELFATDQHVQLAEQLRRFEKARVVVSYYDSPRLTELYPGWVKIDCSRHKHLHVQNKRGSERKAAPEVLLVNGAAVANGKA